MRRGRSMKVGTESSAITASSARADDAWPRHLPWIALLMPALHRQFELGGGAVFRPDRHVLLTLQLDQIRRRQDVLAGRVELHAVIAHDELIGLEVGRLERR